MTEIENYTVSDQTTMFLRAYDQAELLFKSVADACAAQYGEEALDDVFEPFNEKYLSMIQELRKLIFDSITDIMVSGPGRQI